MKTNWVSYKMPYTQIDFPRGSNAKDHTDRSGRQDRRLSGRLMPALEGELLPAIRSTPTTFLTLAERDAEILRRHRAGATFAQLGEEHGVTAERIRQIVRAGERRERQSSGQALPAPATEPRAAPAGRELARQAARQAGTGGQVLRKPPVGTPQHVVDRQVPVDAMELILAGVPENTRTTYRAAWNQFRRWCDATGRTPEPATEETLLAYLGHLKSLKRSPSTVWVALSAIRKRHRLGTPPLPWEGGERLTLAVKGYTVRRLEEGWRPARAVAARRAEMRAMLDAIAEHQGPRAVRDRAMLVLLYRAALRRSELCTLRVTDIEFVQGGMTVHVPMSKTDKSGHGALRPVRSGGSDPRYNAVTLVGALVDLIHACGYQSGPLMRPVRNGEMRHPGEDYRMTGQSIENAYKRLAGLAGLRGKTTPHGPRRGFATDARADKFDPLSIARAGGWSPRSQSFLDYMEDGGLWEDENPGSMTL